MVWVIAKSLDIEVFRIGKREGYDFSSLDISGRFGFVLFLELIICIFFGFVVW